VKEANVPTLVDHLQEYLTRPDVGERMKPLQTVCDGLLRAFRGFCEQIGAVIQRMAESRPSPGYEPWLIERGSNPILARMIALRGAVSGIIAVKPEGDKVSRMAVSSAKFEARQVLLPERAPWLADLEGERDYNPAPGLERIQAVVLAINSADDERNPPETGIMERQLKRVRNARLFLIPGSEETAGHLTTAFAKFWKQPVQELLQTASRIGK
jgi:hypothetical protein